MIRESKLRYVNELHEMLAMQLLQQVPKRSRHALSWTESSEAFLDRDEKETHAKS